MTQRILFVLIGCAALAAATAADGAPRRAQTASTRPAVAPQVHSQGAISIVNDQIISEYDLSQRIALFFVTSGVRPREEEMKFVREQVLRSLQDEILQVKEAVDHGVTVTKEEVDKSLAAIAADNNTTVPEIEATLAKGGVAIGTFRAQITAQLAWNKTVQGRYGGRLDIREEEVNAAIERVKQGSDKPQFRIYEIYLAVDKPEDDAKVRATAEKVWAQITGGAPFSTVARQFSQAPSAAQGGEVGWVVEGQLSDELNKALVSMRRGDVSKPIRSAGGYYILALRGRREPAGTVVRPVPTGPPTGPVPLARFMLPMPANAPAGYREKAVTFANNLVQNARSCPELQSIAKRIQAVYMSLGTVNPKNLSAQVQAALAKTEPGGLAPPFISSDGIEIIARCDQRADPIETIKIPTPEEMRAQLFQQRVGMLARSYLRDLRRDAVIETR